MTVTVKVLVPAKIVEASQTTQYTATGVTAIIDKFTATNYSASAATISVNLVTVSGSAGNANLITKTKTLQASEVYTFPELVGQVLGVGDFISTIAGTATAINMRVSGREVTRTRSPILPIKSGFGKTFLSCKTVCKSSLRRARWSLRWKTARSSTTFHPKTKSTVAAHTRVR